MKKLLAILITAATMAAMVLLSFRAGMDAGKVRMIEDGEYWILDNDHAPWSDFQVHIRLDNNWYIVEGFEG